MKNKEQITVVVFRKRPKSEGGGILALFPYENHDGAGRYCVSYEHVGQHGAADYRGCIRRTKAAKPEEYADLKRELEGYHYFYRLAVRQRANRRIK